MFSSDAVFGSPNGCCNEEDAAATAPEDEERGCEVMVVVEEDAKWTPGVDRDRLLLERRVASGGRTFPDVDGSGEITDAEDVDEGRGDGDVPKSDDWIIWEKKTVGGRYKNSS